MFQQEIAENTINLHFTLAHPNEVGIANYEVTLGDFSDSARADDLARTENYLTTLEAFSANNLSLEQELSRDVFIDYFELQLAMAPYSLYEEPLSPSGGVHAQLPLLFEEYAFYDEGDIKDYLQLLSQLDDYFAQIICFEKEKVAAGLFMPDYACRSVIAQCREFVADAASKIFPVFQKKNARPTAIKMNS